jgi:four helix bundle protein
MAYDHKKLDVWQRSRKLAKRVYVMTSALPNEERFGLTSQIRRAAVSITANLAEGYGRQQQNDRRRFIEIALGSSSELDTLLILVADFDFFAKDDRSLVEITEESTNINRMLLGLWNSFEAQ